jgi:hypothetical protein
MSTFSTHVRRAALAITLIALSLPAAAEMSARDIMQQVRDRNDGNNAVMDMNMALIDANGNTRRRSIRSYRRDDPQNPADTQSIMFFLSPASVEGTAFLTYDYDESGRDDDQWLYLPALNRVRRIASSDKSASFMGSDFTYADMSTPNIDDYDYELMKEDEVGGHKVWQILAVPKTDAEIARTGYTRTVSFVRQDNFVVVRSVHWLQRGGRMKFMEVRELEQIDGIWTPLHMVMSTRKGQQTEHTSVLRWENIKYDQALDDELFTQRRLSQGP